MIYRAGRRRRGLLSRNQFPARRWLCEEGVIAQPILSVEQALTGVSVECAVGLSVAELAVVIPHGQIGVTTAGAVRQMGGDAVRTTGRSPYHATVTGLTPEQISGLLTPTIPNPAREA